jgi:hypothetical protein
VRGTPVLKANDPLEEERARPGDAPKRERASCCACRKADISLHGKGNSNSHGARPVYQNHLDDMANLDQ